MRCAAAGGCAGTETATPPMVAALSDNGALPDPLDLLHRDLDALVGCIEGAHAICREVEGNGTSDRRQTPDIVDPRNQPRIGTVEAEMHKGLGAHILDMDHGAREGTSTEIDPLRTHANAAIARRCGAGQPQDVTKNLDPAVVADVARQHVDLR